MVYSGDYTLKSLLLLAIYQDGTWRNGDRERITTTTTTYKTVYFRNCLLFCPRWRDTLKTSVNCSLFECCSHKLQCGLDCLICTYTYIHIFVKRHKALARSIRRCAFLTPRRYASAVCATSRCSVETAGWIKQVFLAQSLSSTNPTLCYKEIRWSLIIRLLPSGALSQTLNLADFSTFSPLHVERRMCYQLR